MPSTLAGWCDDGDPLIDTNFMVSRQRDIEREREEGEREERERGEREERERRERRGERDRETRIHHTAVAASCRHHWLAGARER
jgi:hypothetical protein